MVDISILKEKGITSDRMKEIFLSDKGEDFKIKERIRERIRNRVTNGIQENLVNYRYWWACDLAWDVPFRQTTSTLVRGLVDKGMKTDDILKALEGVDITGMITY